MVFFGVSNNDQNISKKYRIYTPERTRSQLRWYLPTYIFKTAYLRKYVHEELIAYSL